MFRQIRTPEELKLAWDALYDAVTLMFKKTGVFGSDTKGIMYTMVSSINNNTGFILLHFNDETRKMDGFMFAVYAPITENVEFMGMWSVPGVASKIRNETNILFEAWCREKGAKRIIVGLLNRHGNPKNAERFLKWFHEPLGYKNVGLIAVKELDEEEK